MMISVEVKCPKCQVTYSIKVKEEHAKELMGKRKRYVQDIVPYLTPDQREMFISGYCGKCYDTLFDEFDKE